MKKWITSLFAVTLISGCSTTPSSPKPHPEKFTFQVISIEIPQNALQDSNVDIGINTNTICNSFSKEEFEAILQHPHVKITEYPIVIAEVGESVTNDQTKATLFPEDYDIVEGKAIPKEKIIGIGLFTSVSVEKIENEAISFHIHASDNAFKEWEEYPVGDGLIVKMPFFNRRSFNTTLTLMPNSWVQMGGLINPKNKESTLSAIRVIPPNTWK